jgi:hypothetical protein
MKNIKEKMVGRMIKRVLLPLLGIMWFSGVYSAISVRLSNGQEFSQGGNSVTVDFPTGGIQMYICIDGVALSYDGENHWIFNDNAGFFTANPWIENGCYTSNSHAVGVYSFFADADAKTITVKAGGADGYITPSTKEACRRNGVSLHADNVIAGDLIRWAKVDVDNQDTLFLTQFDDNETLEDKLDTAAKVVRFFNRILRKTSRIDTLVVDGDSTFNTVEYEMLIAENFIDIPVKLDGCGYSILANNASACLSEPIQMTCTFEGASTYRWVNVTTSEEQETTSNKLEVRPKGNETYQVYADGMLVGSIDLIPKSMAECGYTFTAKKDVLCLGKETELSTNFNKASKYEWYADGVALETTSVPNLSVKPTATTTYTLYADGFLVGELTLLVEECTFFIASRYPLVSCLQDSNVLMASGTAVLEDLNKTIFKWSKIKVDDSSREIGNWEVVDSVKTYRFTVPVDTANNWKYRVEYDGLDTTIIYFAPDCSQNVFCDGLEAKTLFYETFGYFMSEDVYVNNFNVYQGSIEVNHRSSITIDGQVYYPSAQFDTANVYYQNGEEHTPLPFSVDNTAKSTFNIRNYIAPDPNGYVVTPKKNQFSKTEPANCYVASDGHLFLAENPRLALYNWWGSTRDGGLRLQDGYYAIVMNPDSCDQQKESDDFISTTDATGNTNGAMLFVNAGSAPGAAIYAQHVSICPDRRFTFGMDVRNAMAGSGNPVNMTILLLREFGDDDQVLSSVQGSNRLATVETGDVASGASEWHRIDEYIELTDKIGDFWVVVYNNGQSGSGNDILIDDITFSVCIPKVDMVVYNSAGDTLGNDVVSCQKDSLSLVAHRRTPEPESYFMFQILENGAWIDMVEYDKENPSLAKGGSPENGEIKDTIKISTDDPRYSGTIKYRVVTGDNFEDVWAKAREEKPGNSDQSCAFSNNVSESIITIKNTFGGKIDKILEFEACDSINSRIVPTATRGTVEDDITWLAAWVDANNDTLFAPKLDPVTNKMQPQLTGLSDSLDIKILSTTDSTVSISYKGKTIQKKYKDIVNMKFIYYYEGGDSTTIADDCSDEVDLKINLTTLLKLTNPAQGVVKGCNKVDVAVRRNLSDADFDFEWYDSKGNLIEDNDLYDFEYSVSADGFDSTMTLIVNKDSLAKISVFEGKVIAKPSNVKTDKYCFDPLSVLEIPFELHNGYYQLQIIPSANPVCISEESDPTEIALSMKIGLKDFVGSAADSLAILNKLYQYNWHVKFTDKDGKVTAEYDNETAEPIWNLMNSALRDYTSQTMTVAISSSLSDVCETIDQASEISSLNIPIREGGISLALASPGKVCLLDTDTLMLTASVSPKKSLVNILDIGLKWYLGDKLIDSTVVNSDSTSYHLVLNKVKYPELFTAGNSVKFRVMTYDDKCESDAVSPESEVLLNGTGVKIIVPDDNCIKPGGTYKVEAKLDSAKASSLFETYTWKVNGEVVPSSELTCSFIVDEASPNTSIEFIGDDGICSSKYSANIVKDINVEYSVSLSSEAKVICSTGSAIAVIKVEPASSRALINKFTWYAVKDGNKITLKEYVKSETNKLSDSLTITSVAYPDLFTAGGSFELFVVAEDGICEAVESDSRLNFDVNVPFKVAVESSGQTYCIDPENPEQVTLKAIVTPANAANHIDNYVWERLSLPVLKETTTSNTFILTDKWLSPGVNNEFRLSVTDGICATDTIKSSTNISLNYKSDSRVDFGLSYRVPNRDTICSEKDLVILSYNVSNSDDESGTVSYDLKLYYDRKGEFGYEQLSNNIVQTSGLHLDEYLPGDSLRFKIVVDDNICSTITKEVGTVVLTPFTASINVSKDPICENENVKFELANFKPEQSANYVKYYSWYQSSAETDGNFVPLSDFDNRAYETNQLKAGNYKVLSFISDGICYGVQMFGDPQGSVYSYETPQVELKVNAPIKVELIPSADAYCEGETPNPITFAAKVTQGEPSKYVWYNSENKVVKEILSTSTEDYFTIEPTVSDNAFKVEVYDGVCNTIGSAAENSFSVAVYQPFVLDVASSAYDICLGDSVNLGLGVLQGTARNITWSGDKVIPNKDNNIYSFAYPQLPGEAFYSVTASNGVCEDETVHVGPIIVHEPITVELTSNVSNVTIGAKIDLTANVLSGKPLEFEWMDGDVSIGKTNDVILEKYMPRSTSVFSLYATDGVCPVAFAQLELGVVLPTAFTPHTKDGLNDVYMEGYEVIIFDRYGQKVFEGANGWNGTHKGVMADPGVYFSQVKLLNGKIVSGTIEIVKYD